MSKPELINRLKEKNPSINKSDIEEIIETFFENIIKAIKDGKVVEIRSFGKLYLRKIKENFSARNPKTNELIYKPERTRLRFKASSALKKLINR